ncbi:hypothetical protein AURDEDRAFT_176614 [Auricularia subglabra TFB-10046 SS5]|uniref:Uncharacterized protein n=1 Tax=Auricularia subglabra (strain TFB-10046 / SS5) TaxID=717982 RepID=J0CVA9_AURST|nr:hypothetical protein AURDEDRAFT_176614 [Auricularia subglabra TFB-10046 SS5]
MAAAAFRVPVATRCKVLRLKQGPLPALRASCPIADLLPVHHRKKLYEKRFKEHVRAETRLAGSVRVFPLDCLPHPLLWRPCCAHTDIYFVGPLSVSLTRRLPLPVDNMSFGLDDLHCARSVVALFGLRNSVLMEEEEARHVHEVLEGCGKDPKTWTWSRCGGRETVAVVEGRWKEVDALLVWAL